MNLDEIKSLATYAFEQASKFNPSDLEIYLEYDKSVEINIENGSISGSKRNEDTGLGIRAAFGNNVGMGFTTDVSEEEVKKTVEKVVKTAKKSQKNEEWMGLPTKSGKASPQDLYHKTLLDTTVDDLAAVTTSLLESCKIEGVQDPIIPIFGGVGTGIGRAAIINSNGIDISEQTTYAFAYMGALAIRDGKSGPDIFDFELSRRELMQNPDGFAQKLAKLAYDLAAPKKTELPEKIPVILHPFALNSIVSNIFLPAIRADIKQQGNSFLADRLGEELVPKELGIYDDGTIPQCGGSSYYDAEGIAKRRTPIFENGVFSNFLYDHYTAQKDDSESTGNAKRTDMTGVNPGSYASAPRVGHTNWVITEGKYQLDSLMSDIELGLFIRDVQGAHQGSYESGDYTGVANPAWVIRNGELTEPVAGIGLGGNILELFGKFEGATSVARSVGSAWLPHVRFSEMRVVS